MKMRERRVIILQASALALGAVLLVLGILSGELTDILRKATTVCLECIGIG